MKFRVLSYNIFRLPGNSHVLHLGTIGYGLREFIVMFHVRGPRANHMFIEEAVLTSIDFSNDVYAGCKFIKDDELAEDLARFAAEKGLTDMVKISNELFDTGRGSWLLTSSPP